MLTEWLQEVEDVYDQMVAWRRHLHENPELPFEEENTARMVGDILAGYGIEVRRNVGGYGVVGTLKGANTGPTIGLRADMDALPIQEENEVSYKSQVPGVMHACGHDAHTATLLGVAKILSRHRDELDGTVVFIFQPAEEQSPGGAIKMIEDGALEGIDFIFGNHVLSSIELGNFAVPKGNATTSLDTFTLTIQGVGGHSSAPHTASNPIVIGSIMVNQSLIFLNQRLNPAEPIVAAYTNFNSGVAQNVIPSEAILSGTIRTFNQAQRERVEQYFKEIIDYVTKSYGATYKIDYNKGYPALFNTEKEVEIVREALHINGLNLIEVPPVMASEDFAYYVQKIPGVYFFTGSATEDPNTRFPHHHPRFNVDERAMKNSAKAFLSIVDHYLVKKLT
ncbi:M20 metallopeptidase family protein [Ureibacillus manganicus]|uniref:Peptidase M20 n=1 Tax=Ureibacillus manganicus DSM 26584 TaxID=1384049 RepID=A0A0A3HZZ0_9BACL|nr:amidohydrolase [Ureibacillus manganicus]KGR78039.1 peptidase M20 [Ureibacillus manganicus DSM 26584]